MIRLSKIAPPTPEDLEEARRNGVKFQGEGKEPTP